MRKAIVKADVELREVEFVFVDKTGNEILVPNNSIGLGIGIGFKGREGADGRL